MGYQSRKRNYKSRRERLQEHGRNFRIIAIFIVLAIAVLLFRSRYDIYYYLETFFY